MEQAKKLLLSLTSAQRWSMLLCGVAVAAGVFWFSQWQRESGLKPLYTGLAPEDASAMVQKLREGGVAYKVSENGTSLLVPQARIPELRLEMAGLGLPKTGRIGFEIFDKTNFGITDFAEHVNYRRAVEGELERSVMALAEVHQARVHVTLPKESVFTEAREAAKASVLVGLRPGARLSSQNVTAISNLVSSAVEGLAPESVSIVDMSGNLLSRPRRANFADGAQITEASLEYRQAIERDLAAKINNTLEPLLGADKFRTGVSADVDMTSGEQSEESFDPSKSVMLTSQKTEDSNGTTRPSAAPVPPGTASNLPSQQPAPPAAASPATTSPAASGPAATSQPGAPQQSTAQQNASRPSGTSTTSTKRTESITYQSSRTTKHLKLPQGTIKRLSIAVLVDQGVKWEGQGNQTRRIVIPPDPEKMKTIQSVVATLVGLNPQRGDQLTVETLPFDSSQNLELSTRPAEPQKKTDDVLSLDTLKKKPALLWGSVGGAVLLLGLVIFAFSRRGKQQQLIETQDALPMPTQAGSSALAGSDQGVMSMPGGSRMAALMPSRTEVLITQLQEISKNNPEAWAGILRGWLSEEEAS